MNIAIFGLGYVGIVTAACFARDGHHVVGVDIQPEKVDAIRSGSSPIIEPGLSELIASGVSNGRIEATTSVEDAVNHADLLIICVGTPSRKNGSLNLDYVENVCRQIGAEIADSESRTTVVVRSTVLPGSATSVLIPALEEASGLTVGEDFGFAINPEFLREGSAIRDFDSPPYTVIGEFDERSGAPLVDLYRSVDAPVHRVGMGAAEMVKYSSNAFHALKVAFANEIGNACKAYGIDSHEVMDIFVEDTKLNLSPYYLKPGFSFGGSCLPKDLRALLYATRTADVEVPVLESILPSNELQTAQAFEILKESGCRRIGLVGLSFKSNTDDLRESPAIDLAERLLGKGYELHIYDREVSLSRIHGSNRAFIDQVIPHLGSLMETSLGDTVDQSDAVVVAKRPSANEYDELVAHLSSNHVLVDLVRLNGEGIAGFGGTYHGISW